MPALYRPTIDLVQVQLVRKAVLLAVVIACLVLLVFGDSYWPGGSLVHEAIEWAGIFLIVVCIIGRTWCTLYIGGSKIYDLVTVGPYSVSRNPLYVFSIAGAAGAGAQLGSVVLALAAGLAAATVFYAVVLKEEQALVVHHGNAYRQYLAEVPRFFPKLSLWRDVASVSVRPSLIRRTFVDACVFLLAIPLAEGAEYLHETGILTALFHLP
jgi:protein-S-isoprenylcysteine O-methyltransferase Ste14